jgi:competence protein ComEC
MGRLGIILLFCLALTILTLRFFFFFHNQPKYHDGQTVSLQTALLSEPRIVGSQQRISANLERGNRIFITTSLYPQFHYADSLRISGTLRYKTLRNKDTIITMWYPKIEVVKDDPSTSPCTRRCGASLRVFLAVPSFIRQKAISLFEKTLPPTSSSLLLGVVFGVKESLPSDFADSLRVSGVFHVVAASGMNVTMVGGFLSSLFEFFFKRQIAILASIMGIALYAVLAGLEPSIIRASIMGILVFTGQMIGRQNLSLYGLFLAGFAMLFWSPNLILDIGFQLSFLATLGLLYVKPLFERSKKAKAILNRSIVGEGVVTTIAAQAGTLPILAGNFGAYSLWSVIVNGLVLWTIPTLMVIGGFGVMLGMIAESLGRTFLYLSIPLLLYFEKLVSVFTSFGGVVNFAVIPWQFSLSYYSFLVALVLWLKEKS